jgi:methionine aminopeptidase
MPVIISNIQFKKKSIYFFFIIENKAIGVMKTGHSFTIEPMINAGKTNE